MWKNEKEIHSPSAVDWRIGSRRGIKASRATRDKQKYSLPGPVKYSKVFELFGVGNNGLDGSTRVMMMASLETVGVGRY